MDMPIRVFWSMNAQIARLRSEEILEQIDLSLLSSMNCDGEMIKTLRQTHLDRMGEPMVMTPVITAPTIEEHTAGIDKLKPILGG